MVKNNYWKDIKRRLWKIKPTGNNQSSGGWLCKLSNKAIERTAERSQESSLDEFWFFMIAFLKDTLFSSCIEVFLNLHNFWLRAANLTLWLINSMKFTSKGICIISISKIVICASIERTAKTLESWWWLSFAGLNFHK